MKLGKYIDKSKKKRKVVFISLGVIVLISVSLLLYKTFASFTESAEFPIMNGKVDYFGNSDVYFAFYKGDEELDEMPQKDNKENLVFDYAECDNEAYVEWNQKEWAPLIKNLIKSKTKCSLYFKEKTSINICNKYGDDSALCYISKIGDSDYVNMAYDHASANGVLDDNLRYIGADPNNYVSYNNEIWRIIGIMNNITEVSEDGNKIETTGSYLKIMRNTSFTYYSWDSSASDVNNGLGVNEWSEADIQKVLNNDYLFKENRGGICYSWDNNNVKNCPNWDIVGIDDNARKMIANIKWNTGASDSNNLKQSYENERGTLTGKICDTSSPSCNDTVPRTTTWIGKVGLIYPSDYGYAVGGNIRNTCLNKATMTSYNDGCNNSDWLYYNFAAHSITPTAHYLGAFSIFHISQTGGCDRVRSNSLVGGNPT